MSLFIPPNARATDANNLALPGATWTFYVSGTTTLAAVYTTSALTTQHENPVPADGGGLFADIYLDSEVAYRAVLKSALGTTIADIDPYTVANVRTIVATRAAMAALDSALGVAVLIESGYEGDFFWDASDLSAEIALNPDGGVLIPPATDVSGASGAWRRPYEKIEITDYMFGAVDGADNTAALNEWGAFIAAVHCASAAMLSTGTAAAPIAIGGSTQCQTNYIRLTGTIKATTAMDSILTVNWARYCTIDVSGLELWGLNSSTNTVAYVDRLAKNGLTFSNCGHAESVGSLLAVGLINYGVTVNQSALNHFMALPYVRAISCGSSPRAGATYKKSATWTAYTSTQNGTTTNGSAIVTGLTDTSSFLVGYGVTGTGIASNSSILSIDSSTQITLSSNAIASGTVSLVIESRSGSNNSTNQKTKLVVTAIPPTDPQSIPQLAKINGYYYRIDSTTATTITLSVPYLDSASIAAGTGTVEYVFGGAVGINGNSSSALRIKGCAPQLSGIGLFDATTYGAVCEYLAAGSNDVEVWQAYGNNVASIQFGGKVIGGYSENAPVVVSICSPTASVGRVIGTTAGATLDPTQFYKLCPRASKTVDTLLNLSMSELAHVDGYAGKLILAQNGSNFTATWDPTSVAAGGSTTTTVSLPYIADLSTSLRAKFSNALQGCYLTASITASNASTGVSTATVRLSNPTAGAIDLASGTLTVTTLA